MRPSSRHPCWDPLPSPSSMTCKQYGLCNIVHQQLTLSGTMRWSAPHWHTLFHCAHMAAPEQHASSGTHTSHQELGFSLTGNHQEGWQGCLLLSRWLVATKNSKEKKSHWYFVLPFLILMAQLRLQMSAMVLPGHGRYIAIMVSFIGNASFFFFRYRLLLNSLSCWCPP